MTTLSQTARVGSALAAALIVVAAHAPSAFGQRTYNPQDGGQIVNQIYVQLADGTRANSDTNVVGWIGVQQCKRQIDKQLTFRYEINPNFGLATGTAQAGIEYDEVNLLEFGADQGIDGSCTHEGEQDACRRLTPNDEGVIMEPEPGGFLTQRTVEVTVEFETLISHFDDEEEACQFVGSNDGSGSYQPQSSHLDAGMMDDADAGAMADAGDGGGGTARGADRAYVVRAFFTGREISGLQERETQVLADAPLILDRTRPAPPSNVAAGATENVLKVAFDPPSENSDVEDYFVFFSTEQLSADTDPETLADRDAVTVRPLSGTSGNSDDGGQWTGQVTGIDQTEGESLYVGVVSRDGAENYSRLARTESAIEVQRSVDFWEKYKEAGGTEPGGCACSAPADRLPGSLLAVVIGLAGLFWTRRRTETE